jgi:integrase
VRNIVTGCGFKTWADIAQSRIESFLGGLDIQVGTYNGYVASFKQFCMWCVRDGKATHSPVQFLDRIRAPHKEKRRPLAFDEVCRLLETTSNSGRQHRMKGLERAVLYLVGIVTGCRANELRQLTVGSFDLAKAIIKLDAKYCKDRRDATQLLPMALVPSLKDFLAGRDPMDPAFNLLTKRTAAMLQRDAVEAGLPIIDGDGRELVFHSLRHTLRTELVKARVTEAVIDRIMRHKPAGVGQRFYTHVTDFEIREAIERLPEYPWPAELPFVRSRSMSS